MSSVTDVCDLYVYLPSVLSRLLLTFSHQLHCINPRTPNPGLSCFGWHHQINLNTNTVIHRLMTHHVTVIHQTVFLLACNTKCIFFFEINCSRSTKILSIHICCKLMELCFNTLKTSTFSIADLPNSGILNLFECI